MRHDLRSLLTFKIDAYRPDQLPAKKYLCTSYALWETCLAGICAGGAETLVIVQMDTLEQELLLIGYTDDKLFAKSDKGYMATGECYAWFRRCNRAGGFTFMMGRSSSFSIASAHCSDEFVSMCKEENIDCMFLPPYTSDQLQPCDLELFAVHKRWMNSIQIQGDLNRQAFRSGGETK